MIKTHMKEKSNYVCCRDVKKDKHLSIQRTLSHQITLRAGNPRSPDYSTKSMRFNMETFDKTSEKFALTSPRRNAVTDIDETADIVLKDWYLKSYLNINVK